MVACSGADGPNTSSAVPAGSGGTPAPDSPGAGALAPPVTGGNGAAAGSPGGAAGVTGNATDAGAPDAGLAPPPLPSLIGDVAISLPSQSFREPLAVELTTAIEGAEIRYTTDGSLPAGSSQLYGGALSIAETTQLRAQAFVAGQPSGAVSSAIYIARDFDFSSDLPIMIVDGYGGGRSTDRDLYLDAAVMLFEPPGGGGEASLAALPTVATRAGYHLRGQSSSRFPQTPYRIELWDNANEDADYPLAGMPAESDWALIAPYYDRTLIRNPFVYTLGRELGLQAPRTAYVELYLRYEPGPLSEGDYQGVYWLTETIKNSAARTDLSQLRPDDTALPAISGGYIFKFDQAAAEEPILTCSGSPPLPSGGFGRPPMGDGGMSGTCWVDLEVVDPDPLQPEQAAWLTQHIQAFHDVLHEEPIGDYAQYIDVASFVDYLIVNELTRNVDAYVRSAYYFKERDGKLQGGPLWDYNFSLAVGGQGSIDPEGGFQYEGSRNVSNWYPRLTADPAFMSRVHARWQELRQGPLSDAALAQRADMLSAPLTNAVVRDYARWPVEQVYANPGIVRGPTAPSWQEQLDALRTYLQQRASWIDTQYR